MTQELNTNLQAMLSQVRVTSSNLFTSGSAAGSSQYANSIFSLINEGEAAANGGNEQKAHAIIGMVQNLISMIAGLSNEKAKAQKDVNNNTKKVDNTETKAEKTAEETKQDVNEIISNIDAGKINIQDALEDLKALSGEDGKGGELAQQQEKLQKILDEIEAKKDIVNDANTSIEEKNAALAKIKGLSGEIYGLVANITDIQKSIDTLNGVINENAKNIEDLGKDATGAIENGIEKLKGNMQQAAQQMTVNTADSAKGTAEEVAGAQLVSAGSATSVIPLFGQSASAKAIQVGTDLIAAGGIRISGAATNITKIVSALGQMTAQAGEFQGALGNVIGSMTQANDLIGQYGSVLEPTITSIGSWSQVADANAALEKEIQNAETKLNGNNEAQQNPQQQTQTKQSQPSQQKLSEKQTSGQNNNSTEEQKNVIFNFDKKAFGI